MPQLHNLMPYVWNPAFGAFAALVASAAVRAMPAPLTGGSRFYLWFYGFLQLLLANLDKSTISISAVPVAAPPQAPAPVNAQAAKS
jgi:hypothetical protein